MGQGRRKGEKGGRETIRMTDKDKEKERNTVYQEKEEKGEKRREGWAAR